MGVCPQARLAHRAGGPEAGNRVQPDGHAAGEPGNPVPLAAAGVAAGSTCLCGWSTPLLCSWWWPPTAMAGHTCHNAAEVEAAVAAYQKRKERQQQPNGR